MKTIQAIIIFSVLAITGVAQNTILIGVEAGPTLSHIRNKDMTSMKPAISYAAGVSFEYLLNENLGLKSGLLFEQKSAKDEIQLIDGDGNLIGNSDIDNDYQYLVLPLLLSYHTGGSTDFYFNAGPFAGFLLSHIIYYEENEQSGGHKDDLTSETSTIDFGVSIGMGANIPLNETLLLGVDLRENLGITEAFGNSRTNSVSLLLGLKYKL